MEINETKQVLLKDKPLLTVTEAAATGKAVRTIREVAEETVPF